MERPEIKQYKETHPDRRDKITRMKENYPGKIPVFLLKLKGSQFTLKNSEFLVNMSVSLLDFLLMIRRSFNLPSERGLYLYLNNSVPKMDVTVEQIYNTYADEDGCLYILYTDQEDKGN